MLVLNIWEGKDKWSLIGGSPVYGHAAITMPAQGHGEDNDEDTYISWWPGGGDDTGGKNTKTVTRDDDRSFMEDLWAENSGRYLAKQIFTLPLSIKPALKKLINPGDQVAVKPFPEELRAAFKGKNHELMNGAVMVGRLTSGQYLVHDTKAKKGYLVFKGNTELKVSDFEGMRPLFDVEMPRTDALKLVAITKDCSPGEGYDLPDPIRALCADKKYPLSPEADLMLMSGGNQFLISTKEKATYMALVQKDANTMVISFFQLTRSFVAPSVNIEIPTLTVDKKGLDDVAILRWWRIYNLREHPKWSTFEKNCSVIVNLALRAGGSALYAKPHTTATWLCWTPTDVKKYAESIVKGIGSKQPKKKATMEGGFDFDTDGIDWKTGTCLWTRDEFEKQSKLKTLDIRSGILKDIDKAVDDYHKVARAANKASYEARDAKLEVILEKIAKFTESKPDSKRAETIFQLGERVLVEKNELIELM